jgi:serine/threonine protein kinase
MDTVAASDAGAGAGTGAGTVLGTRGFMAPEQAAGGAAAVDQRADVYGLGAILVTLLAGGAADEAGTPAEKRLERLRDVPRRLRAICAKSLAADPAGRYPSVEALAADVSRFRAGEPVEAYRENPAERVGRVLYKYRAAALLVLAYLLMRVIVAITMRR